MTIVCKGWEGIHADERVLGMKEPLEDPRRSDTLCPACREAMMAGLRRLTDGIANASPQD